MGASFIYDYGQAVQVAKAAPEYMRPGKIGSVYAMREFGAHRLYSVEFSDGQGIEIVEEFLERLKDE